MTLVAPTSATSASMSVSTSASSNSLSAAGTGDPRLQRQPSGQAQQTQPLVLPETGAAAASSSSSKDSASPSNGGGGGLGFAARLLRRVSSAPDANKLFVGDSADGAKTPPPPPLPNVPIIGGGKHFAAIGDDGSVQRMAPHEVVAAHKLQDLGGKPIQGVIDPVHGGVTLPSAGTQQTPTSNGKKRVASASATILSPSSAGPEWPTFPGSPVRMDATATSFSSKDFERGYAGGKGGDGHRSSSGAAGANGGLSKGRSMISFPGSKKREQEKEKQRAASVGQSAPPPTANGISNSTNSLLPPPSPNGAPSPSPGGRSTFRRTYSSNSIKVKAVEVGPNSFSKVKMLGKGDVGKVYLVREKKTERLYAMKGEHVNCQLRRT